MVNRLGNLMLYNAVPTSGVNSPVISGSKVLCCTCAFTREQLQVSSYARYTATSRGHRALLMFPSMQTTVSPATPPAEAAGMYYCRTCSLLTSELPICSSITTCEM